MPQGTPSNSPSHSVGVAIPAWLRLVLGSASGAVLSLSFTGRYFSLYSWIAIAILIFSALGARTRIAFASGFLHAIFFVFTSVPWIAAVLSVHGGLSVAGAWGVLLLIASAWGVLIGSFSWAVLRVSNRGVTLSCIAAPFVWVTFEFIRTHLPEISFPWNLLGYPASANLALLQLTTLTGIYGLSFLVAAFNALLAWAIVQPESRATRLPYVAIAAAILLCVTLLGPRVLPSALAHHLARSVQLNFPEVETYPDDWFRTHLGDLADIERLSLAPSSAGKPDLLVWPEAPAPFSFQDLRFAKLASALAIRFDHPFLVGSIEWKTPVDSLDPSPHNSLVPYNSALLFDSQGQRVFVYDKVHLVPFGEYEPFPLIHHVVSSVSSDVGGFHKGNKYLVGKLPGGETFGVFICYEAIYPGEVRRFAAAGAHLLINISNDGWFGRSAAAEQHLRMARVRAVENRRWIIRTTNNGFTAAIDPFGRIYQPLAPDIRAAADLPYDFRTDQTIYTRFGDWFAWLCVLVSVILGAATFRKANIRPALVDAHSTK